MNQPSGKIIEIGAVIGDLKTGEILSLFEILVNPSEDLDQRIKILTDINQSDVESSPNLKDAYRLFASWTRSHQSLVKSPITWGGDDAAELRKQILHEGGLSEQEGFCLGHHSLDAKTLAVARAQIKGDEVRGGLARSLRRLGLAFQGQKHRALTDAYNTFRIYRALLSDLKGVPFSEPPALKKFLQKRLLPKTES